MAAFMAMMLGQLGSSALGYFGSKSAANSQSSAANQALALQQQMYQQNAGNLNPWIGTGQGAEYTLGSLYGLNGKKADYSSFYDSPDYKFALQQGQQATQNILGAKGNLLSGGGMAALTNYGQGMAAQQYTNYVKNLMGISGMGEDAAKALASSSATMSNGMSANINAAGAANAAGTMGGVNALAGGLNGIGNSMLLQKILGNKYGGGNGNPSGYGQYTQTTGLNYDSNGAPLSTPMWS